MKKIYIVLFLILIIIYLLYDKNEYYSTIKSESDKEYRKFSSQMKKKEVKQGSDALDGLLFEDVNLYESEHTVDGELGLEKCIKNCKGMCVEFGMTGDAYCFPEDYADISKNYTETIKSTMGFRKN
jgi:hypothetical protein